jgi:hypothetical protein
MLKECTMAEEFIIESIETEMASDGGHVELVFSNDTCLNIALDGKVLLYDREDGEPIGACSITKLMVVLKQFKDKESPAYRRMSW